jgi:hypothetical protein
LDLSGLRFEALNALGGRRWRVPLLKLLLEDFASARVNSMWHVEAAKRVEVGESGELTPARLMEKLARDPEPAAFGALAASGLVSHFRSARLLSQIGPRWLSQVDRSTVLGLEPE